MIDLALLCTKNFDIKICWNRKVFPYEMRQYCEPKTLTRILMPTPFLVLNVFRYAKFSETQKGSLTKSSGTVKQNSFTENPDTPTPLMHEKFLNQIFSETMKASLRNVSIQWDKKILGKSWRPSTFFSLTFFQKKFLKHRRAPLRKVSVLWDQKTRRRIVMCTHFLFLNIFWHKKFLKHRTVHLRKVWVLWDKNFQRKIVKPFPLLCMKNFD